MSFDIFLIRFENGEPAEAPRQPVYDVLKRFSYRGPSGFYTVTFSDGVSVEFNAGGLDGSKEFTGCAFHVRGFGKELARFVLEIAQAGDMVIFATMAESPALLISEDQKRHLPPDVTDHFRCILIRAPTELELILRDGYDAWADYRDQIVQHPSNSRRDI